MRIRTSILLVFFLLGVALIFQLIPRESKHVGVLPIVFFSEIEKIKELSGGTDLVLADSEEMKAKVGELLNFDSFSYFRVEINGKPIDIYAAYWTPGRQRPRYVGDHTPDICWTLNGWTMQYADFPEIEELIDQPQFRFFTSSSLRQEVLYLHTVGGRASVYSQGLKSKGNSFFNSFYEEAIEPIKEQYFIRISTPASLRDMHHAGELAPIYKLFAYTLVAK